MSKVYAGIGSRSTPYHVKNTMTNLATALAVAGWRLRTGGAEGADTAFEQGACCFADIKVDIFLPWKGFNRNQYVGDNINGARIYRSPTLEAVIMGCSYHPKLKNYSRQHIIDIYYKRVDCGDGPIMMLMGRNVHQILGYDLQEVSSFVVCWTEDAADGVNVLPTHKTGGTGQAIRVAMDHNVPVFNLENPAHMKKIVAFMDGSK